MFPLILRLLFAATALHSCCASLPFQHETVPQQPAAASKSALADPSVDTQAPLKFALIADFGWDGPGEKRVADLVHSWQPSFVVAAGDDNYPDGAAATLDRNIGQYYHDFIAFAPQYTGPYAQHGSAQQRFFAALGNHDWHTADVQPFIDYFDLPGNKRYFQVSQGPVDLFVIDSDPHEPDGVEADSKQAQWLKQAMLASVAPYKVVVFHHPPYSSGPHGGNEWMQWPFKQWGASLIVSGHDHHYERIVMDGLTHVVVGTGGAELRNVTPLPVAFSSVDITYSGEFGALLAEVRKNSATFKYYEVGNHLRDTFEIPAAAVRP
jgi:tartrate-resistant acid phosphatase type 5